jgi:hypothetical protein
VKVWTECAACACPLEYDPETHVHRMPIDPETMAPPATWGAVERAEMQPICDDCDQLRKRGAEAVGVDWYGAWRTTS